MKKFESQLGQIVLYSENIDDLIQNMEYDAVLLAINDCSVSNLNIFAYLG